MSERLAVEAARERSSALFGQRYRLELMGAIASAADGIVCQKDLASELDVSPSNIQKAMRDLVRAGLLSPLPSGDSRRRYYLRAPSLAWAFAEEMLEGGSRAMGRDHEDRRTN